MQNKHTCHWPGCTKPVPPRLWGCKRHWFSLPMSIRDEIWNHYRPGQEIQKNPSLEYLQAIYAAHQYALTHPDERITSCSASSSVPVSA